MPVPTSGEQSSNITLDQHEQERQQHILQLSSFTNNTKLISWLGVERIIKILNNIKRVRWVRAYET
jgi:hypothetical protein